MVKEDFHTENHVVNIEAIDFDGEQLLIIYKVQSKIEFNELIFFTLALDVRGDEFTVEEGGGLATGGPDESGIYYGYSVTELNFEKSAYNNEKIIVSISPKSLHYIKDGNEIEERINDSRELKLTIKNKNYR